MMTDATYKMVWEGFSVMFVARVDQQNHGHPICLVISTFEKSDNYADLISSINIGRNIIGLLAIELNEVITDAAGQINNEFEMATSSATYTRFTCFVHVLRNNQKKFRSIKFKFNISKEAMIDGIRILQK